MKQQPQVSHAEQSAQPPLCSSAHAEPAASAAVNDSSRQPLVSVRASASMDANRRILIDVRVLAFARAVNMPRKHSLELPFHSKDSGVCHSMPATHYRQGDESA